MHIPIRAGSDIAFLGGLIRHIIETKSYFEEYVVNYTNAPHLVREDFQDTEDLDGLFSGFDPEKGTYDRTTWLFEGMEPPAKSSDAETQSTQAFTDRTQRRGDAAAGARTTRRSSTRAASCRSCAATTPATRRRWCRRSAASRRSSSSRWPRR